LSFGFDTYTLFARIGPSVVVASPLLSFAALSGVLDPTNIIAGFLFSAACILAAELTRDAGKRLEPGLWAGWGGSPTLRRMRFDSEFPPNQVSDRHRRLEQLLGRRLPDARGEAADPAGADVAYEEAIYALRERTRDRDRFELLFRENVAYGFRRNLLGIRRWGILAACIGLIASVVVGVRACGEDKQILLGAGVPAIWAIAAGFFFIFFLDGAWVQNAAEEYAERLFGALQVLAPGS
jgi:hypothetical protein